MKNSLDFCSEIEKYIVRMTKHRKLSEAERESMLKAYVQ